MKKLSISQKKNKEKTPYAYNLRLRVAQSYKIREEIIYEENVEVASGQH